MFTITLALSIISSALRLWLIARIYLMDRYREYPVFVAHNAVAILTFVAVLCVRRHAVLSYLTYWTGEAASSVLALLVILAIFKPAAEVLYLHHPRYRLFLPIGIVAIIAFPVWQGFNRALSPTRLGHVASGIYSFVLGILCLQAIILAACFVLALSKRIPWGNYDFAIVSGFGISAVMKCVAYLVRWNFGSRYEAWFQILLPGATTGAVLVWLMAFLRSEPRTTKQEPDPRELQKLLDLMQEHTDFVRQILKDPRWRRHPLPDQPR
jgi:hypothetical protein